MNEQLLHLVHPYMDIDTKLILGIPPRKLPPSSLDHPRPKSVYLENKKKLFKFFVPGVEVHWPVVQVDDEYFIGEESYYVYDVYLNDGKVYSFPSRSILIPVSGYIKIIGEEYG